MTSAPCHLQVWGQAATPLDFPSTLWGCNTPSKDSEVSTSPVTGLLSPPFPLRKFPSPTSVPQPPSSSFYLLLTFSSSLFTSPRPLQQEEVTATFRSGADDCLSLVENRSHRVAHCGPPSPGLLILHTLSPFSSFQVLTYNFNCRRQTTLSEEHCDIRTLTL